MKKSYDVFNVDLKILDKQIELVANLISKNKKELDLQDGLLNLLYDIYSTLENNGEIQLITWGRKK